MRNNNNLYSILLSFVTIIISCGPCVADTLSQTVDIEVAFSGYFVSITTSPNYKEYSHEGHTVKVYFLLQNSYSSDLKFIQQYSDGRNVTNVNVQAVTTEAGDGGWTARYSVKLTWVAPACTCGACCKHKCTCGNAPACGGTPSDCECHECNHCCSCTCDCEGGWQGVTCQGHAAGEACEGNSCSTWGDAYHCDCHKSCECEACCSCECTCGEWQGEICGGEPEDCECHEEEGEEGCKDCENCGGCCEHHKKDYKPPPNVDYSSVGKVGIREQIMEYENDPKLLPPKNRPVPEFVFFEWDPETGELPKFRSEEAWETFAERIGEKFNLDFLGPFGRGETDYGPSQNDLLFRIDFEIFGVKVGPWEWDMMMMFRNDLGGNLASVIRVILLFIVTFSGIVGTLNLLFWAK